MFMDHRHARHWLPETVYMNQYREPGIFYVGTFAEDLDLTTGTPCGSEIRACDLSIWREQALHLSWGDSDTRAITLGWNTSECDTLAPAWHISWPDGALSTAGHTGSLDGAFSTAGHTGSPDGALSTASAWGYPVLTFSLAAADETANPPGKEEEEAEEEAEEVTGDAAVDDLTDEEELIDFTIRLTDRNGAVLEFPLSDFSPVQPVLKRTLTKLAFMQKHAKSETILQYYCFPLERYAAAHPGFEFDHITSLSFIFNITPEGVVVINNIGL